MKKFLILTAMIMTTSVFAHNSCHGILLNGYEDSYTHQVRVDDIVIDDSLKFVSNLALHKLLERSGCKTYDLKPTRCKMIIPNVNMSEVCYSENMYGYYIVQKDFLDNINIIVNRWD